MLLRGMRVFYFTWVLIQDIKPGADSVMTFERRDSLDLAIYRGDNQEAVLTWRVQGQLELEGYLLSAFVPNVKIRQVFVAWLDSIHKGRCDHKKAVGSYQRKHLAMLVLGHLYPSPALHWVFNFMSQQIRSAFYPSLSCAAYRQNLYFANYKHIHLWWIDGYHRRQSFSSSWLSS